MHAKLTTKLIWGVVGLSSLVILLTSLALSSGIYILSERGYKSMLASGAQSIIYDYLRIEDGKIFQTEREDGDTLGVMLRSRDLSAIIVDKDGNTLARYGVEKDLGSREIPVEKVESPEYEDVRIDEYGIFDTYTVPLKANGITYGWMRLMRQNSEVVILSQAIKGVGIVIVPLSWLIAGLVAWIMSRQITRPLSSLVEYLEKIRPEENEQKIVDSPKMDYEVWVVSQAINKLVTRIRENLGRQQQISENISHEFKTPLTRIVSNLDVGKIAEAKKELLELGGNVDALLSLSIWEKNHDDCDVVAVIKDLVGTFPGGTRIKLAMPKKLLAPLPSSHAKIIWRNILDNAIKYSNKDEVIVVSGEATKLGWLVDVTNSRDGVPSVPHKFTERKYRRGDGAGYGIGMSIVDEMCKLHGLKLSIESRGQKVLVRIAG